MAITEYYVSVAGAGAHDGTSAANAWTLSEAITANNALGAGGAAGRRYNVTGAHTARGATDTISVGGTATSPAIWRGYNAAIGDLDNGTRDAYGVLDTASFPDIGYNSTYGLTPSAGHIVFMNLDIATNRSSNGVNGTVNQSFINCRIVNSNTGGSTTAIYVELGSRIVNCDLSSGASSGTAAISCDETVHIIDCRITSPGAIGIKITGTAWNAIHNCTIFNCGTSGIDIQGNGGGKSITGNTIYACVDAINVVSTASGHQVIVGNMITDNSGYGIDFNGGTSGTAIVAGNRFRDNASGNTNGYADYVSGTNARNITTDTGGAATDYVDAATNKDFAIVYDSPGFEEGFSHRTHIGSCGFELPTPATIAAAAWNDTTAPNRTLT